ncbi:hypothetical protein I5M27_09485 [Adhaeribacter sp. BT258]|uniref:Lipoprotein n=1 Tax=Adhaeribacter terrigena TaxID=2793070 RepID=A0ABS1C1H0_9BACT|nr:hypothetical protein [Adhaeribacter terrigena]MBK0403217.1 hypothetical protein [Adhaeribacter terrigena]
MRNMLSLLLVAMVCMSSKGCFGGGDLCDDAPKCEARELGVIKLDPASEPAIPFQGNETVTFVNPQGFQAIYKAQGYKTEPTERLFTSFDPCGCSDYYLKQQSSLLFTGQNLNFDITYQRVKNMSEDPYEAQNINTTSLDDALLITLGETRFAVPVSNAAVKIQAFKQVKLHDSLAVGNQVFRQVIEVYEPYLDPATIRPKGIYYTRQQGLVAYYFTNNELWYRL